MGSRANRGLPVVAMTNPDVFQGGAAPRPKAVGLLFFVRPGWMFVRRATAPLLVISVGVAPCTMRRLQSLSDTCRPRLPWWA